MLLFAVLFCFLFFKYLFPIFLPFCIGWLLSLLFAPLADRLERYHISRGISALLGILLIFAALGLLGFWSGNSILHRVREISENLPYYTALLESQLTAFWARFDVLVEKLPPVLQTAADDFQKDFSGILLSFLKNSGGTFSGLPNFFLGFFVALLSAYFLTKDRDTVHEVYTTHLLPLLGGSVHTTKQELKASVWGYIKTQLILMGITFVAALCAVLATMHLMRFYYCKKYDIICDEKGNKTSPLLFAEKKEKESLPKRILVTVCKVVLLLFLALTLVGVYMVSQQPPA